MYIPQYLNKPAEHVIVDLINRSLYKQFKYTGVDVAPIETGFDGNSCFELSALSPRHYCADRSSFEATVEGFKNTLKCNYYRLYLNQYIDQATVEGFDDSTDEDILTALNLRYGVFLTIDDVTIERLTPTEEDVVRVLVTPNTDHLVWVGSLPVNLVPGTHIGLEINRVHLGSIKPFLIDPVEIVL